MRRFLRHLKAILSKHKNLDDAQVEALRNAFQSRYHHFKLLLNANNKSLDVMSETEGLLRGDKPFGMADVRSLCTMVSTSVWQMVHHLNELAPGKYEMLFARFKEIRMKINPLVQPHLSSKTGALVLSLMRVDKNAADEVGSKMANLGEIQNYADIHTAEGFVVTAAGFYRFMAYNDLQEEINRRIQSADKKRLDRLHGLSADIQQMIIRCPLPPDLEAEISRHFELLEKKEGHGVTVALRSSALGEDFSTTSFAGQYRSVLNVSKDNLFQAYKEVVSSKYNLQAMNYRFNRGIRDEDVAMCVGCISMVDAVCGGVAYTRNPLDIHDDDLYISSVWGLPKTVVDGSAASDLFVITRNQSMPLKKKEIVVKKQKFACYPDEGICRMDITGEKENLASLTEAQARAIARLAIRLETHYGTPQDIEWAIDKTGGIDILQCRPLKQTTENHARTKEFKIKESSADIRIRGGTTASPGVGSGPIFIAKKDMDMLRFPKGAVLVTSQALPRWASVLNRASALITEQGGTAGHLANVAREFGVPALFGARNATTLLENNQVVTVDADAHKVYKGRIASLLALQPARKNLMQGSPVYKSLEGCARHIVPLNLMDPDSPKFKPGFCRTFHDITRYCHEKVVDEMFRFGKAHHFPERSSKQLYCDVPMQWWVLNLDDGFKEEVTGKYVRLENIVSVPMLALWEGIATVPWEGPPALDKRGFMSVMFEATTNRALTTGMQSNYANRNYFMISKNYCSLSSRLGFHFSTVETLVSERLSENYISFQFKGGAADYHRRIKRVLFVKEILEEYDFRVTVREDNLMARLENRDMNEMKNRLKIIGYLTIHTRQLDMIMANDASVDYYKNKTSKDLMQLLGTEPMNI